MTSSLRLLPIPQQPSLLERCTAWLAMPPAPPETEAERRELGLTASTMLIPVVMTSIGVVVTATVCLGVSGLVAVPVALGLAYAVLLLDRGIVGAMSRAELDRSSPQVRALLAARIGFTLAAGLLVAQGFIFVAFRSEIESTATRQLQAQLAAATAAIHASPLYGDTALTALRAQGAGAAGGLPLTFDVNTVASVAPAFQHLQQLQSHGASASDIAVAQRAYDLASTEAKQAELNQQAVLAPQLRSIAGSAAKQWQTEVAAQQAALTQAKAEFSRPGVLALRSALTDLELHHLDVAIEELLLTLVLVSLDLAPLLLVLVAPHSRGAVRAARERETEEALQQAELEAKFRTRELTLDAQLRQTADRLEAERLAWLERLDTEEQHPAAPIVTSRRTEGP